MRRSARLERDRNGPICRGPEPADPKKLGPEHEAPPIVAIGEGAADESEADGRDRAEDTVEPQLDRRVRQLIEQPVGCRHLHPSADVGNKKADPKKSKIAIVKGGETPDFSRVRSGWFVGHSRGLQRCQANWDGGTKMAAS